jgi:hypothetical protein
MQQLARKRIVPDAARHGACRRMNLLDENIIASQEIAGLPNALCESSRCV